ncbi:hypothetical protein GCM10027019_29460 [Melaminivora jejuensis]
MLAQGQIDHGGDRKAAFGGETHGKLLPMQAGSLWNAGKALLPACRHRPRPERGAAGAESLLLSWGFVLGLWCDYSTKSE